MTDRAEVRTLRYVNIEDPPLTWNGERLSDYYEGLPEPFGAALLGLTGDFDGATCVVCHAAVGYILTGDPERVTWRWTTLVQDGEEHPVRRTCEDCQPGLGMLP